MIAISSLLDQHVHEIVFLQMQQEFKHMYPHMTEADMAPAEFQTTLSRKIIQYCKITRKCIDLTCEVDLDEDFDEGTK